MGVTFFFHAPHIKQRGELQTSALLVRGEDRFGNYEMESPPDDDGGSAASDSHEKAVALYRAKEAELGKVTVTRLD